MRKPGTVFVPATRPSPAAGGGSNAPTELVCLALAMAVIALAARIVSIW
jgi:hypothetical protein